MNRLMERGLLENRATRVGRDPCLPLRMQSGGWTRSPVWQLRLSRRLGTTLLLGLSGGTVALACHPCLRALSPTAATVTQAVIIAIAVMLVHAGVSTPRPMPRRTARDIIGSASSN